MHRIHRWSSLLLLFVVAAIPASGRAQSLPDGFQLQTLAPLQSNCTSFVFLPDGRIVVTQRPGKIFLLEVGASFATEIYAIEGVSYQVERGLLGIAVDPNWPTRPYLYVFYTHQDGDGRVGMLTASGDLTDSASLNLSLSDPYLLIDGIPDEQPNHNAGDLNFGPDGMLYVSTGDDGDPCESLELSSASGKILRLDVAAMPGAVPGPPLPSQIAPSDNPFPGSGPVAPLVYLLGLRNPYRFDIDQQGELVIADVGSDYWEEINYVAPNQAGTNLGWPKREGFDVQPDNANLPCTDPQVASTDPVYVYARETGAAVVGGAVYRNVEQTSTSFGLEYEGNYFLYDFIRRELRRLSPMSGAWQLAAPVLGQPSSDVWAEDLGRATHFEVGPEGALYFVTTSEWGNQPGPGIHRIVGSGATAAPPIPPLGLRDVQVLPNPSGGLAGFTLRYRLPRDDRIRLDIFSVNGRRVRRLERVHSAGSGAFSWDGRDESGQRAPAGIYLYQLQTDAGDVASGKLAVVH